MFRFTQYLFVVTAEFMSVMIFSFSHTSFFKPFLFFKSETMSLKLCHRKYHKKVQLYNLSLTRVYVYKGVSQRVIVEPYLKKNLITTDRSYGE